MGINPPSLKILTLKRCYVVDSQVSPDKTRVKHFDLSSPINWSNTASVVLKSFLILIFSYTFLQVIERKKAVGWVNDCLLNLQR